MPMPPAPILIPLNQAIESRPGWPAGFYRILDAPAPLAGCAFPFNFRNWDHLHGLGFRHVFCLASENPRYSPHPLRLAVACELDDLSFQEFPIEPAREAAQIQEIAQSIVTALQNGEGCLVHCAAGRGRSGSVIGVALRMLGIPAPAIISHLNALHFARSGASWPESPWQADLVARNFDSCA